MTTGQGRTIVGAQSFEGWAGADKVDANFSVDRDLQHRMVVVSMRLFIPEEYIIENPGVDNHFGALRNVLVSGALGASEKVHLIAEFLNLTSVNAPTVPARPETRRALDLGDHNGS